MQNIIFGFVHKTTCTNNERRTNKTSMFNYGQSSKPTKINDKFVNVWRERNIALNWKIFPREKEIYPTFTP